LDAVIPVHSHFDHAMDAPLVAELTGAKLIGSSSSLMIGKGAGLSDEQMMEAPLDRVLEMGKFKLRFVQSHHWHYPSAKQRAKLLDQDIEEPLVMPASIYDFKEGISYTLLIEHESTTIAIHGSAGYKENSLIDVDVDLAFVSIAGLEAMDDTYISDFQHHTIDALHPEVIVPIHWDDFNVPLHKGLKTRTWLANKVLGGPLQYAVDEVEQRNPNRQLVFLELWQRYPVSFLLSRQQGD